MNRFTRNIAVFVNSELSNARRERGVGQPQVEFKYLESAHVLGQESTFHHVKVHFLMLFWGVRNGLAKEIFGQVFRIVGAATKTVFGLVPQGNTGGSNVSPFKPMPLNEGQAEIIAMAKQTS